MSVFIGYPSFMAYQMMKGKKGNNDDFPSITGMIARYSALGLTNEQMAANPVWVDKTGNGHDLQMKNFAWKEGSGISDIYPGALVFDGVDDWAGCDNLPLLPKEKGYSIIALRNWITRYDATQYKRPLISNLDTNDEGAFLIEYRKDENVNDVTGSYNSFTDVYIDDNNPITWQTSSSYNGQIIKKGTSKSTNKLSICKTYFGQLSNYANAAIWEIVILDHDATEEELTKIKDYFIKTYPWLFPDQAWTVVGKTNEDEDRATIANITGNGNDLVLSNFGFAEGSGYGLYNIQKFTNWNHVADRGDIVKNGYSVTITNSKITGSSTNYNTDILYSYNNSSTTIIFKVTGLVDGQKIFLGRKSVTDAYVIDKDGIYRSDYNIPQEDGKVIVGIGTVGFTGECNITIEQIPEYEGYLITDGVDDEIISAKLIQFADKFTIVGDWKFMEDRNDNAGLLKSNQIYIYNATTGMRIYLKQGSKNYPFSCKKINALTSDGWVYDEKWDKYKVYPIGSDIDISSRLFLGFYSSNFTKIALKNLGIYNDQLLSKDDCIKAYNYLQTLKAK